MTHRAQSGKSAARAAPAAIAWIAARIAGDLLVGLAVVSCTALPITPNGSTSSGTPSASPPKLTLADATHCPTTRPNRIGPSGAEDSFFGWGASYGNGQLWVGGLWPDGVIAAGPGFVNKDGSVGMKFGWWRAVPGLLTITGRRLDAPAPPLYADVSAGYGQLGFQASGINFPTDGCWEVTGKVGSVTLSFVTFVIKQGA